MARDFAKSFYRSTEWQKVRSYVMMRDSFLCVICGKPAEEVHHVIHLSPDNILDPSISLNPENLKSLCRDCHFETHRQDKLRGYREHIDRQNDSEYEFDENGYLVKKETKSPPIF